VTTKDRPLYAYRLIVEYPPGVVWPQTRRYLSLSGAKKRADLLRRYGCVVGIQRSERIEWVEP
jgi:hypothetical protein